MSRCRWPMSAWEPVRAARRTGAFCGRPKRSPLDPAVTPCPGSSRASTSRIHHEDTKSTKATKHAAIFVGFVVFVARFALEDVGGRDEPGHGFLADRREFGGDQQLVLLADRAHAALRRPGPAGRAGGVANAGALVDILVDPGVNEFVEAAEFAGPSRRQGRRLLARPHRLGP